MISVIIPVYNGELLIRNCLQSIKHQIFKDIEIILVDNNSTDNSMELINEFASENRRNLKIIVLSQPVQGIAHARNKGLETATGHYVSFIDQDDTIDKNYFEQLHKNALVSNADIVVSGYRSSVSENNPSRFREIHLSNDEWSKFMVVAPWGKLFKRSYIMENRIRFLPVIKGEDVYFVMKAYNLTDNLSVIPYVGYNWINNKASLSRTVHRKLCQESSLLFVLEELKKYLFPLKKINMTQYEYFVIKSVVYDVLKYLKESERSEVKHYALQLFEWVDSNFPDNSCNPYIGFFNPKGERFLTRVVVTSVWKSKDNLFFDLILRLMSLVRAW